MNYRSKETISRVLTLLLIVMMLFPTITSFAESVVMTEEIIEESNEVIEEDIVEEDVLEELEEEETDLHEEEAIENEEKSVEAKAFSVDNFATSNVNYAEFHMGYKNINLSDIKKEVNAGETLRVVVYNPEAKVALGDMQVSGKLELVSYVENMSIQELANTHSNVEFKNFVEVTKTVNGEDKFFQGRSEDEVNININVHLNEHIGGSTYCCTPPGGRPEGLPEDDDSYKHDGYRDINISLTEFNDLELNNLKNIKVSGIPSENYEVNTEDSNVVLTIVVPRELKDVRDIEVSYTGELPDVKEIEEYTTKTGVKIDNEDIKVSIPGEAILAKHLTEYTVKYVTESGKQLTEPETFVGEIGTTASVGAKECLYARDENNRLRLVYKVAGNNHQYKSYRYKASLELDKDSSENEIVFVYQPYGNYGELEPTREEVVGVNTEYVVYHVDRETNINIVEPTQYIRKINVYHNELTNNAFAPEILEDINYKYSGQATSKRTDRNTNFTNLSTANRRDGTYNNSSRDYVSDVIYYYDSVAPRIPVEPEAVEGILADHLTNYTVHYKDEAGNTIMDSDKMLADKGGLVKYTVDCSLREFYWNPVSQYRANENVPNVKPLSPHRYQEIEGVENQELTFVFKGSNKAEYIDKNSASHLYKTTTVRHRDATTKKDIVEPTEYKLMGKSYISNKAISKKNQLKIGYKLVDLKYIDSRGNERSLSCKGKAPTEYKNNCQYDLIFDYEYVGAVGSPGWENPNPVEETVYSNEVEVSVKPKNPQEVTVQVKDKYADSGAGKVYATEVFTQYDGDEIYPEDVINVTEDFKINGKTIKSIIEDNNPRIDLITKLPLEYTVIEATEGSQEKNVITIEVVEMATEEEMTNYTIRHVYKNEETNEWEDIIDRRIGEDKVGNSVRVKPEVFKNFKYLDGVKEKWITLEADVDKNIVIFRYEKEGDFPPNPSGRYGSYVVTHSYEDNGDEVRPEQVFNKVIPGVIVSVNETYYGFDDEGRVSGEVLVSSINYQDVSVTIGQTSRVNLLYTRALKFEDDPVNIARTHATIRLVHKVVNEETGQTREIEIERPFLVNGIRGSVVTVTIPERLRTLEYEGETYKIPVGKEYGSFNIGYKEEAVVYKVYYEKVSK